MADSIVNLPLSYFPDPNKGRPLGGAKIYIGIVDLNPRIEANQLPVFGRQEGGLEVPISQPVRTSFGGVPVDDNGNVVTLLVDGAYSLAIDDSKDVQKYYFANTLNGVPLVVSDVGSAAFANTGTAAGQLPLSEDLGMSGGETNMTSGNLNLDTFGGLAADDVIATGWAVSDSTAVFHLPISRVSAVNSINVVGSFNVLDAAGGAVTLGIGVTALNLLANSSNKVLVISVTGLQFMNYKEPLQLTTETAPSKVVVL